MPPNDTEMPPTSSSARRSLASSRRSILRHRAAYRWTRRPFRGRSTTGAPDATPGRRAAREPDDAGLHHVRPVRHRDGDVHRLLDEEDRRPGPPHGFDGAEQLLDHDRRQSQRELVDEEQLGTGDGRHGEGQHLLLATGQVARPLGAAEASVGKAASASAIMSSSRSPRRRPCHAAARRFSSTRRFGKMPSPPGTCATPRRAISSGGRWVMSRPSKTMAPWSASTTPPIARSRVDLPAPLVPSRATISPSPTSMATSPSTSTPLVADAHSRTASRGRRPALTSRSIWAWVCMEVQTSRMSACEQAARAGHDQPTHREDGDKDEKPVAESHRIADARRRWAGPRSRGARRARRWRSRRSARERGWRGTTTRAPQGRRWQATRRCRRCR